MKKEYFLQRGTHTMAGLGMASNNIVLVGEMKGYLLTSIKNKLHDANFEVFGPCDNVSDFSKIEREVRAILIYADGFFLQNRKLMEYVKNKATEEDIPIFVIGYDEELTIIKEIIPDHLIQWEIERPVDVKEMISGIQDYLMKNDSSKRQKILVVDDSNVMLNTIKGWLEDKYQITLVDSGLSAIKSMILNRPDLILLDYNMPICDGKQTLEMIRAEKELADIPVIFLTAKSDRDSIMGVMSLKPQGYLLKAMMKPGDVRKYIDEFFQKKKKLQMK